MGYKNKFWSLGPEGLPFHLWSEYGIKSAIEDYKTAGKTKGILLPGTGGKVAKKFLQMGYENKFWSLGQEPKGIPIQLIIKHGLQCTIEGNKTAGPSKCFLCLVQFPLLRPRA